MQKKKNIDQKKKKVQLPVNSIFTRAITELISKINQVSGDKFKYEIEKNIYNENYVQTDVITLDKECLILIERYYSKLSQEKLLRELQVDKLYKMHVYYLLVTIREIIFGGDK